ncbi:TMEM175 family protein [Paucilactobacillus sp. N302-9]
MNKQRLEAFTDAILAIIMTIMVLEIHAPSSFTFPALTKLFIPLLAYVISFIGLTNLWASHHFLFEKLHHVTYGLFIANMALILWLSLVPVTTAWVAEHPTHFVPQAVFMIIQFGWTTLLLNLQRMCKKADANFPAHVIKPIGIRFTLIVQVVGTVLSFFLPYVVLIAGSLIIVVYVFRPTLGDWQDNKTYRSKNQL